LPRPHPLSFGPFGRGRRKGEVLYFLPAPVWLLSVSTVGLLLALASSDLPFVLVLLWPGAFSELPGPSGVEVLADLVSVAPLPLPDPLALDVLEDDELVLSVELLEGEDLPLVDADELSPTFSPLAGSPALFASLPPSLAFALEGSWGASLVVDETAQPASKTERPIAPRLTVIVRMFIIIRSYQHQSAFAILANFAPISTVMVRNDEVMHFGANVSPRAR